MEVIEKKEEKTNNIKNPRETLETKFFKRLTYLTVSCMSHCKRHRRNGQTRPSIMCFSQDKQLKRSTVEWKNTFCIRPLNQTTSPAAFC